MKIYVFQKKKQIFKFFICKIITLLLYSPPLRSYNSAIALKKTQKNRKDRGKMNVFGLEVTEVTDVKSKKVVYQGVEKTVLYASIQCEGGSFRVQVQDGVEIPIGWSGKAVGYCKVDLYKKIFDGKPSDYFAITPQLITKFTPIAKVSRAEDALSAFVSSSAPAGGQSVPPVGGFASQQKQPK